MPNSHKMKDPNAALTKNIGKPLLGNVSLVANEYEVNRKTVSILGGLELYRKSVVGLEVANKSAAGDATVPVGTVAELGSILDSLEHLLDVTGEYEVSGGYKKVVASSVLVRNACSKATVSMAEFKEEAGGENSVVAIYRAVVNFDTAFAKWAFNPAAPMVMNNTKVINAAISYVSKALAAFAVEK